MNGKTSILLAGTIATVLLMSGMAIEEASAFEPTQKENQAIQKYTQATMMLSDECSGQTEKVKLCDKLEEIQMRYLFKINDMGIYTEYQEPELGHLTEEYDSTRAAAEAGVEPVEPELSEEAGVEITVCAAGHGQCSLETMYIQAGYKDPYVLWGHVFYNYVVGLKSDNIPSNSDTESEYSTTKMISTWNNKIIPYCYMSSQDITFSKSIRASYNIWMVMDDNGEGQELIKRDVNNRSSYFVWYDTSDSYNFPAQTNMSSDITIICGLDTKSVR